MNLENARKEFDRLYWEDEDKYGVVIETAVAPDEIPLDEWEGMIYSVFDSTIDALLEEEPPRDVLALVVNGDDAEVARGLFVSGGDDGIARIGDTIVDGASDLDAIAVAGDDIDTDMDFA